MFRMTKRRQAVQGFYALLPSEYPAQHVGWRPPYMGTKSNVGKHIAGWAQLAVEEVLVPPPASAAPSALRTYLQLLAEAYRRTLQLADRLHDAGGADVNTKVQNLCRSAAAALA